MEEQNQTNQTNNKIQFYELGYREVSVDRFKYSLYDIQMENISQSIRDDTLRTAVLNPDQLQEQIDQEREMLLNDLALLQNTSTCVDTSRKSSEQ